MWHGLHGSESSEAVSSTHSFIGGGDLGLCSDDFVEPHSCDGMEHLKLSVVVFHLAGLERQVASLEG